MQLFPARLRPTSGAFQSSSGPRTGCNNLRTHCSAVVCAGFNPHPVRGPDATTYPLEVAEG